MDQQNEIVVAGAVNIDRPAQDALNVHCWEKVFDYLSFDDIYSLSQTCKRLRQIAGCYFMDNFSALNAEWGRDSRGVHFRFNLPNSMPDPQNGLTEFIVKMLIECRALNRYLHTESYRSLKRLTLVSMQLTVPQISYIKEVLNGIEILKLQYCNIFGELYERLLQHCPKLKTLQVEGLKFGIHFIDPRNLPTTPEQWQLYLPESNAEPTGYATNNWLQHEYPTLEHLQLDFRSNNSEPTGLQLITFLEKHSNIKHFGIDAGFIWKNRDSFKTAKVQLDCLDIMFHEEYDDEVPVVQLVSVLRELNELGLYKTLHMYMESDLMDTDLDQSRELIKCLVPFRKFEALHLDVEINVSSLLHLKELCIRTSRFPMDMNVLAKNLVNLEQLYLWEATVDDILPFIRNSMKLHTLRVRRFSSGPLLNLNALNKERQVLKQGFQRPRKVWIYVQEDIYLASVWQMKNLNLELVEIGREEEIELGEYW